MNKQIKPVKIWAYLDLKTNKIVTEFPRFWFKSSEFESQFKQIRVLISPIKRKRKLNGKNSL